MSFAPQAFRTTRVQATQDVEAGGWATTPTCGLHSPEMSGGEPATTNSHLELRGSSRSLNLQVSGEWGDDEARDFEQRWRPAVR